MQPTDPAGATGPAAPPPASGDPDLAATVPFAVTVGVRVPVATPERVVGTLDWSPERCTVGGTLHGGALMTLADTAGAVCAFLNLPLGASTATLSSATNLFRPIRSGTVTATSRPLHVGRSTIVVQTDLTDDQGRLAGQVTQTQAVLAPRR